MAVEAAVVMEAAVVVKAQVVVMAELAVVMAQVVVATVQAAVDWAAVVMAQADDEGALCEAVVRVVVTASVMATHPRRPQAGRNSHT